MGIDVTEDSNDNVEIIDSGTSKDGKFSFVKKANKYRPKDGSKPLTVIEFSLTNEVRDSLEEALHSYVEGDKQDLAKDKSRRKEYLGNINSSNGITPIIKAHMPPEILQELEEIAKQDGPTKTVYVVHNLPTTKNIDLTLPTSLEGEKRSMARWRDAPSYNSCIVDGISDAIGSYRKQDETFPIFRYGSPNKGNKVSADFLHKHTGHFSATMGVHLKEGAKCPTNFTDIVAAIEDDRLKDEFVWISQRPIGLEKGKKYSIKELRQTPEILKGEQATNLFLEPKERIEGKIPDHKTKLYKEVLKDYSQSVEIKPGTPCVMEP